MNYEKIAETVLTAKGPSEYSNVPYQDLIIALAIAVKKLNDKIDNL